MMHRLKTTLVILAAVISACHAGYSRAVAKLHIPTTSLPILPTILVTRFQNHQVDLVAIPTQSDACSDANSNNPASPLARLRNAMKTQQYFDAFLIFYTDEHLSEEPEAAERRLEYFSGWDGPGTGVVLAEGGAALWVPAGDLDRARRAVSCGWVVLEADDNRQPTIADWISERLGRRTGRVAGNARHASIIEWRELNATLKYQYLDLVHQVDLLDQLWNEEPDPARARPEFSKIVANVHNKEYTGESWTKKVSDLRSKLRELEVDAMVVTALDEVAWLLNIRGRDVPTAPLLKAFVVVSMTEVKVYVPPGKVSMPIREVLAVYNCQQRKVNCTSVLEYSKIYTDLRDAPADWRKILIPEGGTIQRGASAEIEKSVNMTRRFYEMSPIIYLKATKNSAEINGMNEAHLRDAVAMCTLLSYLETTFRRGLTEMSVAKSTDENRVSQANYISTSMKTRVSFGKNGAIADYVPTNATNRRIFANSTLIIHSGGQYVEGTTVLTRTIHFGTPTKDEKRAYTITLRSLIAMAMLNAPTELPAAHMDLVVRAPLWAHQQDYPHPTGYGVGAALMRREGPVVLDYRYDTNLHSLKEGYFITVEPAWNQSGKYGVGLGNILQVVAKSTGYIGFNETTLVPYEPKLIEKSMLTDSEITWLNNYYTRIRKVIGKELESRGMLKEYYWMMNKTVAMELPSRTKRYPSNGTPRVHTTTYFIDDKGYKRPGARQTRWRGCPCHCGQIDPPPAAQLLSAIYDMVFLEAS